MNQKGVERVVAVAFPCLQYRVADPQNPRTNTILQTLTASQWLTPSACFGLTHSLLTKTRNLFGNIGKFGKQNLNPQSHISVIARCFCSFHDFKERAAKLSFFS